MSDCKIGILHPSGGESFGEEKLSLLGRELISATKGRLSGNELGSPGIRCLLGTEFSFLLRFTGAFGGEMILSVNDFVRYSLIGSMEGKGL